MVGEVEGGKSLHSDMGHKSSGKIGRRMTGQAGCTVNLRGSYLHDTLARGGLRLGCSLLALLMLLSCVSTPRAVWPPSLPEQTQFIATYRADASNMARQTEPEYLDWIRNFYQGSRLYPTGWEDIEQLVLARTAATERGAIAADLRRLGIAIAGEWAKDNGLRLIDNRLLSLWGYLLQITPDSAGLSQSIAVIDADIAQVLARRLAPGDVTESRYEILLGLELFEGF